MASDTNEAYERGYQDGWKACAEDRPTAGDPINPESPVFRCKDSWGKYYLQSDEIDALCKVLGNVPAFEAMDYVSAASRRPTKPATVKRENLIKRIFDYAGKRAKREIKQRPKKYTNHAKVAAPRAGQTATEQTGADRPKPRELDGFSGSTPSGQPVPRIIRPRPGVR